MRNTLFILEIKTLNQLFCTLKVIILFLVCFNFTGKFKESSLFEREAGLGRKHYVLLGQAFGLLVKGVQSENSFSSLSDKNSEKIKTLCMASTVDQREVIHDFVLWKMIHNSSLKSWYEKTFYCNLLLKITLCRF